MKKCMLISLFLAAPAWAQNTQPPVASVPQWQGSTAAQYVCGGIADEGMAAIKSLRGDAGSELLFTSGSEGAYIADVAVTVKGSNLKEALSFNADGPVCLLKLPKGNYTVEAEYMGQARKQSIKIGGGVKQTKFNWPAS